jgi:hypothetical protein
MSVLGLSFVMGGVAVALVLRDRFVGLGLFIVGIFLIVLPLTRPSLDED